MNPTTKTPLVLPSRAGDSTVNAADCAECAAKHLGQTGFIFRRGNVLMRLVGDRLEVVTLAVLQSLLFTLMTVCKWGTGGDKKPALVPATEIKEPTLKAIIGSIFISQHIPSIAVILAQPILVLVDGKLVELKPGYNAVRGGILVTGSLPAVQVLVAGAVQAILSLMVDFLFATESDKSRAVSMFFSAAMRLAGIHERHPFLVIEANDSQTGKGLFWSLICALFGQRPATVAQKKGGVGSLDESLMEKLVAGNAFIVFDNMRGFFDSSYLEAALTLDQGMIDARVPGIRAVPVDPSSVVFAMTSNGAELPVDLANRSEVARLRKQPSHHDFHTWTNRDGQEVGIRQHVEAYQTFYLGCVNAILRDWWEHGAQRLPCKEHSFKETMGSLGFITEHYFGLAPLMTGHSEVLERTTKPGLTWLRMISLRAVDNWLVSDWTATQLAERCLMDGVAIPGCTDADSDAAAKSVGMAMAQAFGPENRVNIDDVVVLRNFTTDSEGRIRKLYSFNRSNAKSFKNPDSPHSPNPPKGS